VSELLTDRVIFPPLLFTDICICTTAQNKFMNKSIKENLRQIFQE
jgi:hypothetical protein